MRYSIAHWIGAGLVMLLPGGCGDRSALGPDDTGDALITVTFQVPEASSAASRPALGKPIAVEAANGTLVLTHIGMVVDELKLDGEGNAADFEADPHFLLLDLNETESEVVLIRQPVSAGVYKYLKFEVDDPNDALLAQIRQTVPNWPKEASLMVSGTFTPSDAPEGQPFRVFFEGEVKIETAFDPPLSIGEGEQEKHVTVTLNPAGWFRTPDNQVIDLRAFDYDAIGRVQKIEVIHGDGSTKVEVAFSSSFSVSSPAPQYGRAEVFVRDDPRTRHATFVEVAGAALSETQFVGTSAGNHQASLGFGEDRWVHLGSPNGITVQLHSEEAATVHGEQDLPVGRYGKARLRLQAVEITVKAGSRIEGHVLDADVKFHLARDRDMVIEKEIPPLSVSEGARVDVLFELNSELWISDRILRGGAVAESEIAEHVDVAVRVR